MSDADFLAAVETGTIAPDEFRHGDHVRAAWLLLSGTDFAEALHRISRGLRGIASRAGCPERYNETITVAFMALVGERIATGGAGDFAAFRAANPDLFEGNLLGRYYPPEVLRSDLARRTFVLPAPAPAPG